MKQVRDVMKAKGWDARTLAQATELTDASISRFFSNKAGEKTIAAVAAALGLYDPGKALTDRQMRKWYEVGIAVRKRDRKKFVAMLKYLQKWITYEEQGERIYDLVGMKVSDDDDESDDDGDNDAESLDRDDDDGESPPPRRPALPPAGRPPKK